MEYIIAIALAVILLIPIGYVIWWIGRILIGILFDSKEDRAAFEEEKRKIAEREMQEKAAVRKYRSVTDVNQLPSDITELYTLLENYRQHGPRSSAILCAERMIQLGYPDGHYYMALMLYSLSAPVEDQAKAMRHLRKSLPHQFHSTEFLIGTIPAEIYEKHIDDRLRLFTDHVPLDIDIHLTADEAFYQGNLLTSIATTYRQCEEAEAYLLYAAKEGFDQEQIGEALAKAMGRKHYLFGLQCLEEADLKESSRQFMECLDALPLYEEVFEAAKSMAGEAVTTNECEYVQKLLGKLGYLLSIHEKDHPEYMDLREKTHALVDSIVPCFHSYPWPRWMNT